MLNNKAVMMMMVMMVVMMMLILKTKTLTQRKRLRIFRRRCFYTQALLHTHRRFET